MAKKAKEQEPDVPEGYTAAEWAAYQADPVTFCISALKSKDSSVRFNAVDILRGCAGDAKPAIPALCDLLGKEKVATVRAQCAWALGEICEQVDARSAKPAVAPLAKALQDPEAEVRSLAANALWAVAGHARSAAPDLRKALQDRDPEVREAAERALKRIEDPDGV